ncbi:hypothetical protein NKH74_33665 [Mesorhizobium sp. M0933]|uniref:hypothetical protein n=1 Tax=Mesorhizobium sp. M0933 TaxID=2957030 RepID=UPI00333549A2
MPPEPKDREKSRYWQSHSFSEICWLCARNSCAENWLAGRLGLVSGKPDRIFPIWQRVGGIEQLGGVPVALSVGIMQAVQETSSHSQAAAFWAAISISLSGLSVDFQAGLDQRPAAGRGNRGKSKTPAGAFRLVDE